MLACMQQKVAYLPLYKPSSTTLTCVDREKGCHEHRCDKHRVQQVLHARRVRGVVIEGAIACASCIPLHLDPGQGAVCPKACCVLAAVGQGDSAGHIISGAVGDGLQPC